MELLKEGQVQIARNSIRIMGIGFAILLIVLPICFAAQTQNLVVISVAQGTNGKEVVVIQLYEQIDAGSAGMITRGISQAQSDGAAAVIIDMNTPGGLLSDMQTMIGAINGTKIPVYTFVGNDSSAASAGSYVAMATAKIYMAPGSQIGPSTPFVIGGSDSEQQHVQNYALSLMQTLAIAHGRNATAAGIMVSNNVAYPYNEAISLHVADGFATSLPNLLSILNLTGSNVVTVSENFTEQTVSFLSNPNVTGILLLLGIIAIVIDFLHPTVLLSIAGIVMIVLALIGAEAIQGPSASLAVPLVLFAGAAVLIVFELKTGHGFLLFGGVVLGVFATALLTFDVPYSPSPLGSIQYIELAIFVVVGGFLAIYARWVGSTLRKKPLTGKESLVGKEGTVVSDLNPEGEVTIEGIVWRAKLVNPSLGPLSKGEYIVVRRIEGLLLFVEPQSIKEKVSN